MLHWFWSIQHGWITTDAEHPLLSTFKICSALFLTTYEQLFPLPTVRWEFMHVFFKPWASFSAQSTRQIWPWRTPVKNKKKWLENKRFAFLNYIYLLQSISTRYRSIIWTIIVLLILFFFCPFYFLLFF